MMVIIVPILEDDFEHHIVCKIISLSVSSTFSSSSDVMFYLCLCTHFFFPPSGKQYCQIIKIKESQTLSGSVPLSSRLSRRRWLWHIVESGKPQETTVNHFSPHCEMLSNVTAQNILTIVSVLLLLSWVFANVQCLCLFYTASFKPIIH